MEHRPFRGVQEVVVIDYRLSIIAIVFFINLEVLVHRSYHVWSVDWSAWILNFKDRRIDVLLVSGEPRRLIGRILIAFLW